MKFRNAIAHYNVILENGPLGTRLKFDYGISELTDLLHQESAIKALTQIYEGDLSIAQANNLPIILNAATYRASRNHLNISKKLPNLTIQDVNHQLAKIAIDVRGNNKESNNPIFIGAPIGSMGDAYSVAVIPTIEEAQRYHSEQIECFKNLDIDFINVVTIPSLSEAMGIALVAEKTGIDYTIGFILNNEGNLLDNTSLTEAIKIIDDNTSKKPLGYLITCTHASTISLLDPLDNDYSRLIGIQPNGSNLSINQLSNSTTEVSDSPEKFALDLFELKKKLGLKIIGGCCGTTREHFERIITASKILSV